MHLHRNRPPVDSLAAAAKQGGMGFHSVRDVALAGYMASAMTFVAAGVPCHGGITLTELRASLLPVASGQLFLASIEGHSDSPTALVGFADANVQHWWSMQLMAST